MIAIADYGSGNTFSVYNALDYLGYDVKITNSQEDLRQAEKIILPGVGAFGKSMEKIKALKLDEYLYEEVVVKGKPFLGICVGMQVLATFGLEKGIFDGLNWIPGTAKKIDTQTSKLSLPHVGWNDVDYKDHFLFKGIKKDKAFYFVHSYHLVPDDRNIIIATTDYGTEIISTIQHKNIIATQFHPEKSQKNGLKFLENFADWEI